MQLTRTHSHLDSPKSSLSNGEHLRCDVSLTLPSSWRGKQQNTLMHTAHTCNHTQIRTARAILNRKKKVFRYTVFPKKPAGTPCVQPWLVAVGGWRLAAIGGWQLATGGWWQLVVVGGGW